MKAKVDKEILKENGLLFVVPALVLLLGVLLIVLPYKPIDYAALQSKDVTVHSIVHRYPRGSADYHDIRTTDGERYVVKGEYEREQLETLLRKGTRITIKWYRSDFGGVCAEEVYVDEEKVVAYNDDLPAKGDMHLLIGISAVTIGWGSLCFAGKKMIELTEQKKNQEKFLRNKKRKK